MKQIKIEEYIPILRKTTDSLGSILKPSISRQEIDTNYKIPYKLIAIMEIYKHRLYDLLLATDILLKQEKYIPAIILERSILELIAVIYYLKNILYKSIEKEDIKELDTEAMILLVGYRFEVSDDRTAKEEQEIKEDYKTKNILGYIDKMEQAFPDYRKLYDALSEFVHPNFCGCTNSYSEVDEKRHVTYFGFDPQKDENFYLSTLEVLNYVVNKFIKAVIEMDSMIESLIKICRKQNLTY